MPNFTKTERAILRVLSDGRDHVRSELLEAARACNGDPQMTLRAMASHLTNIRKKLLPVGQDVVYIARNGWRYRHVRLLGTDSGEPAKMPEDLSDATV